METQILQPLWYHPTSVLLLDDNKKLLNALVTEIDPNFPSVSFTNPKEALDYLQKNALNLEELSKEIISDIEPSDSKHLSTENIAINFTPLHANLDKFVRFTKTVVAVVDRAMDEMDGLECCRKIRELGLPIKLILLTGHTSIDEALVAFNDGVIDAFVQKSTDIAAMVEELNPHIKKLAFKVFCDSSAKLLGSIINRFSFSTDKVHANFLKDFFREHDVIEYYFINTSGSCLLITSDNQMKVLLVKTEHDFKDAYDIAVNDHATNADVLEALKNRHAFPFTGTECSHFNFDVTQWGEAMAPMKKQENLGFYYGIMKLPRNIVFFDHYVKNIWKPASIKM